MFNRRPTLFHADSQSVAQFAREIVRERQHKGVQRAKREGKYKGRAPTARAKSDDILRLAADG